MLKIRDGIELKELEKFGFRKTFTPMLRFYYKDMLNHLPDDVIRIVIDMDTSLITIEYKLKYGGESWTYHLDCIFDLIQAGLVEKVVEDE